MKSVKNILCTLLVLVMTLSMIPVTAQAETTPPTAVVTVVQYHGTSVLGYYQVTVSDKPVQVPLQRYIRVGGSGVLEFERFQIGTDCYSSLTIPAFDGTQQWLNYWGNIKAMYGKHTHSYRPTHNRTHHWDGCACGSAINKERHVDPATDADKICTCGYEFSHNANLSTLWFSGMVIKPRFNKDTTEYYAEVYTYKEVNATTITAKAQDAMAKVELPKDLRLEEGRNVFQITVTAEDTVTTKTYTVIAVKTCKVGGIEISYEDDATSAEPKVKIHRRLAIVDVPELLLEKMADLAEKNESSQILLKPQFSKWGTDVAEVTIPSGALTAIARESDADLVIETTYGIRAIVPNDIMEDLAKEGDSITFVIDKSGIFTVMAGDKDITEKYDSIEFTY